MNSLVLIKLGQIFRAELMALTALIELHQKSENRQSRETVAKLLDVHRGHFEGLKKVLETLNYSPDDDIALPSKVQKLLDKRNFPERLLLSWLNEYEVQLCDVYEKTMRFEETHPDSLPTAAWKHLRELKDSQLAISGQVHEWLLDSTKIIDPTVWD